ncbi:MAG: SUMF1/EgtB/PvdO family nonheme iron enzyme [Halieaceae bacterium]|nr:SUMF1/EgtB/PvdO family nonheme iron enzyme [Halieaceae bacterium]
MFFAILLPTGNGFQLPVGCTGDEPRVLRGGSWNNNPDNARASNRNRNNPDNRNNNIGFRVVCSSHTLRVTGDRQVRPTMVSRMRRWQRHGAGTSRRQCVG